MYIHTRIIWLRFQGTLRWAILAQASRSWWEIHSANARGQAAARKEEQYTVLPTDKGIRSVPFSSPLSRQACPLLNRREEDS